MIRQWATMSQRERQDFRSAAAFLEGRLEEKGTVEWAIGLRADRFAERAAVLHLLERQHGQCIRAPWQSIWALIEESWRQATLRRTDRLDSYSIARRIKTGERSGSLIAMIVDLVRPFVEIKPLSQWYGADRKVPRRPRHVNQVIWASLSSGDIIAPSKIGLDDVQDSEFLLELANELDAAVNKGLNIGRRLGWKGGRERYWVLGDVRRVYFVPESLRPPNEHEPDEFHNGIAPSVKLLHEVVARLAKSDLAIASRLIGGWRAANSPLHTRLWAALARSPAIATANDVALFIRDCDASEFWDINYYPEIAELRASRFAELELHDRKAILKRLMRGPPRRNWSRRIERGRIDRVRNYWITRELLRIELAGDSLAEEQRDWLRANIDEFDDLRQMTRLDEGFPGTMKAYSVPPNPDNRFDLLDGVERLTALEEALSHTEARWESGPAERASDWIRQAGRTDLILADLESAVESGAGFPEVWERFGWSDSPTKETDESNAQNASVHAKRVVRLLESLPKESAGRAIEGITFWLSNWDVKTDGIIDVGKTWKRLWPIAVNATNARQDDPDLPDLHTVVHANGDIETKDLDTLNSAAGRLVGVFLNLCPRLQKDMLPFEEEHDLRLMRDMAISAEGRSGLIARYRLIESLPWFLAADKEWTETLLIEPLLAETEESLALWRAVARRVHTVDVLEIIGKLMAERANDTRLGRDARRMLVFNVVIQSLHAFHQNRDPVISNLDVQQMLRSLDDEVRAHAADTVGRFVREMSEQDGADSDESLSPELLFRSAARPFLEQVWPRERSLSTPGVARAFANLPSYSGEAFAEAVDVIERFLVPFECWSIGDYGLRDVDDDDSRMSEIDTRDKAEALLLLLDSTIGSTEGAVVPVDLGRALEHLRSIVPRIVEKPGFRRLAALTRR